MNRLNRFSIIVAVDNNYGIGKDGTIPWKNKQDMIHFRSTTVGNGNNAIIMGRKTYESTNNLPDRHIVVVSSHDIPEVETVLTLKEALEITNDFEQVFVIGGGQLYEDALNSYGYLCDQILISHIPGRYECDVFFPYDLAKSISSDSKIKDVGGFQLETLTVTQKHPEYQYLDLLRKILKEGEIRPNRTDIPTKSIFGQRMEFNLRQGFPLLTTKKTWFEGIKRELLFFISGKTDTKILEVQNVNIWKSNTSTEFLTKSRFPWREGDMGPGYSFQWRHAGAKYIGCDKDYTGEGVDQLQNLINGLRNDPFGRRHIISAWDVANIHLMALPPCHCFFQCYVGCNEAKVPTYLDCCLYQRSADMFLGVPFNIASYALLMCMIGHVTGLIPRKLIHDLGDAHIYLNHITQAQEQLTRIPLPLPKIPQLTSNKDNPNFSPKLIFKRKITNIDQFTADDIILENYASWPGIKATMAI